MFRQPVGLHAVRRCIDATAQRSKHLFVAIALQNATGTDLVIPVLTTTPTVPVVVQVKQFIRRMCVCVCSDNNF